MLMLGSSGNHANPVVIFKGGFQFFGKQLGGSIDVQLCHSAQSKIGVGSMQVSPTFQAGNDVACSSGFSANEGNMFGKQIHNFEVVLVVRLTGKPSFGLVRLNVTKENLAWTIGMPNRGFTSIGRARGPNLTIITEQQGCEADGDVLLDAGFVGGKNGFG